MTPVVPPYRRGGGFGSLGVRFREVLEPHAVSLRPETFGAWVTLGVAVVALLAGVGWLVWRYRQRRHRRAAERELRALAAAWAAEERRLETLEAVPAVIKRCALQSFARPKVAPLSGERFVAFLSATGGAPFGEAAGRALQTIATHGASAVAADDAPSLFSAAQTWVRRHRAEL